MYIYTCINIYSLFEFIYNYLFNTYSIYSFNTFSDNLQCK